MERNIIYYHWNTIEKKIYIGQTQGTFLHRWNQHIHESNKGLRPFCKAIRKYGKDAFTGGILCKCHSAQDLDSMEDYYINKYQSRDPKFGYNKKHSGGGDLPLIKVNQNNFDWDIILPGGTEYDAGGMIVLRNKINPEQEIFYRKSAVSYAQESFEDITTNKPITYISEYIYTIINELGKEHRTDTLAQYCENEDWNYDTIHNICTIKNYIPDDPYYDGWIGIRELSKESKGNKLCCTCYGDYDDINYK